MKTIKENDIEDFRKYIDLGNNDMAKIQEEGILMANRILESNKTLMIADDVGLGKTYEGLGLAFYRNIINKKQKSNILIIAPNYYVAKKWIDKEYRKFTNNCLKKVLMMLFSIMIIMKI